MRRDLLDKTYFNDNLLEFGENHIVYSKNKAIKNEYGEIINDYLKYPVWGSLQPDGRERDEVGLAGTTGAEYNFYCSSRYRLYIDDIIRTPDGSYLQVYGYTPFDQFGVRELKARSISISDLRALGDFAKYLDEPFEIPGVDLSTLPFYNERNIPPLTIGVGAGEAGPKGDPGPQGPKGEKGDTPNIKEELKTLINDSTENCSWVYSKIPNEVIVLKQTRATSKWTFSNIRHTAIQGDMNTMFAYIAQLKRENVEADIAGFGEKLWNLGTKIDFSTTTQRGINLRFLDFTGDTLTNQSTTSHLSGLTISKPTGVIANKEEMIEVTKQFVANFELPDYANIAAHYTCKSVIVNNIDSSHDDSEINQLKNKVATLETGQLTKASSTELTTAIAGIRHLTITQEKISSSPKTFSKEWVKVNEFPKTKLNNVISVRPILFANGEIYAVNIPQYAFINNNYIYRMGSLFTNFATEGAVVFIKLKWVITGANIELWMSTVTNTIGNITSTNSLELSNTYTDVEIIRFNNPA